MEFVLISGDHKGETVDLTNTQAIIYMKKGLITKSKFEEKKVIKEVNEEKERVLKNRELADKEAREIAAKQKKADAADAVEVQKESDAKYAKANKKKSKK